MTPEQLQRLERLEQEVEKLRAENESLKNFTTIPFEVDRAFRERFRDIAGLSVSSKGADTEDQAVNEGGAATYNVLNDPVGFLEITISGTTYYLPYY